jgi:putative ABC transport system permease protein
MASLGSRLADILRLRLRSLLLRGRIEHELDEELRFHFDSVVDKYLQSGMSKSEALRRVRVEYGGAAQIKEECRDMRGINFIENIGRDTAYAIRGFAREKAFTAMAVATIALAVGVNTGFFTLVYSLIYRPIPVSDPDSLRNVFIRKQGTEGKTSSYGSRHFASFNELMYLRAHSTTAEFAGVAQADLSWKDRSEALRAQLVSDNLLPMIGGKPVLGRFFGPEETVSPGSAPVVVLSHTLWRNQFGGASDVVGRPIILNRTLFTIIGVADERCNGPLMLKADVWIPLTMQALTRPGEVLVTDPTASWIQVIARRKAEASDAEIRSELAVLAQHAIAPHLPKRTAIVTLSPAAFMNLPEVLQEGTPVIVILFAAVTLVLLLASANVANMLLARGLNRRREIAIRLAVGSGRTRLLQQLLVESAVLGMAAGVLGLLMLKLTIPALLNSFPEFADHQVDASPDLTVLVYTLGMSLLTSVVFGLVPALNCLGVDLTPSLKTEGLQSATRPRRMWLQNALIGVQVSSCLVLLASAALLLRGLQTALNFDAGFASKGVLIVSMDFRQQQYTSEKAGRVLNGVRDAVAYLPGISAAATTSMNPILSDSVTKAHVLSPDGKADAQFQISQTETDPDFFAAMKIPLLQGRSFTRAEYTTAAKVIIVDEELARRHFGGTAVGKFVRLGDRASDDREIIGVAANTRSYAIDDRKVPRIYIPLTGLRFVESRLLINYSGPRIDVVRAVERAAAGFDPGLTVRAHDIAENVSAALIPVKVAAAAAGALAGLALVLACAGLYGVVSFAVSRRRREVGIRLALGAARMDVLRLLLRQGLTPVFIGALIGIALAAGAGQLIRALLYGISPMDPVAFGGTIVLLTGVATLAALIPARGALSVDPAITLRHD